MPIRSQLRLPQISGSLKTNVNVADSGFAIFAEDSSGANKNYLQFDTRNSQEMTKIADVDLMLGTGNIRINPGDLKIYDATNHERITFVDAGDLRLKDADGDSVVTVHASNLSTAFAGDGIYTGTVNGDDDDARTIFASMNAAGNPLTLGGGATVVAGHDFRLAASGIIEDAGGHPRFTATDTGDTLIARADGTTAVTIKAVDGDVIIAGNLDVNGTYTALSTQQVVVEDKELILGLPGGSIELEVDNNNPAVVTHNGHGFSDDQWVYIYGGTGLLTEGLYQIKNQATNSYQLRKLSAGANLDMSAQAGPTTFQQSVNQVTAATATGSGIRVPGAGAEHQFLYNSTDGWASSEDIDLASGKHISFGGRSAIDMDSNLIRFNLDAAGDFLSLPGADGTADQILKTDGAGQLSFTSIGAIIPKVQTLKATKLLTSKVVSNANSLSSAGAPFNALDVRNQIVDDAHLPDHLDVFVNGQLLISGSGPFSTDVSASTFESGDYLGDMDRASLELKFAFDLEIGDVVQVIARPQGQ